MPGLDWLILGVIVVIVLMGWALSYDISRAHGTLIGLHDTLMSLESDVAEIRGQVVGEKGENYGELFPEND